MTKKLLITILLFSCAVPLYTQSTQEQQVFKQKKIEATIEFYSNFHLYSVTRENTFLGTFQYDPAFYNKQYIGLGFKWFAWNKTYFFFDQGFSYGPVVVSSGIGSAHDVDGLWSRTAFGIGHFFWEKGSQKLAFIIYAQSLVTDFKDPIIIEFARVDDEIWYSYIKDYIQNFYSYFTSIQYYYKDLRIGVGIGKTDINTTALTEEGKAFLFSFNIQYVIFKD